MMRILVSAFAAYAAISLAEGVTTYNFGQDINYPPYAFKTETGELGGFGKDVADGVSAVCPDIHINVVETRWSDCWSSANGGTLGQKLVDGTLDACMTYTHTQGIRNQFADFSYGILEVNKAAGLLTMLVNGQPKVSGTSDLAGKTVVDVGGWAPTADGLDFVENKCTHSPFSKDYKLVTGDGNDESMKMIRDGTADVMFVYSDQAYNYQ
jgi:ABC-type amino acid transport substrate-binding protein